MATAEIIANLHKKLRALQPSEVRGIHGGQQATEAICLAILALRHHQTTRPGLTLRTLMDLQKRDGSWPAFAGDEQTGCWVTALAAITLMIVGRETASIASAIHWLIDAKGQRQTGFGAGSYQTSTTVAGFDPGEVRVGLGSRHNELGHSHRFQPDRAPAIQDPRSQPDG